MPDLHFCPSGTLRSAHSEQSPVYTVTPSSSRRYPTPDQLFRTSGGPNPGSRPRHRALTDVIPLLHRLLDEAVGLLSDAVQELGVVAKEDLDALARTASHSAGSTPEYSQNEIPACRRS